MKRSLIWPTKYLQSVAVPLQLKPSYANYQYIVNKYLGFSVLWNC